MALLSSSCIKVRSLRQVSHMHVVQTAALMGARLVAPTPAADGSAFVAFAGGKWRSTYGGWEGGRSSSEGSDAEG